MSESESIVRNETFTVSFDGHLCGAFRCETNASRVNVAVKDGARVVFLVSFARKVRIETNHKTGRGETSQHIDIQELHNEVTLYNCDDIKAALQSAFDAKRNDKDPCVAWIPVAKEWCLSRVNWLSPVVQVEKQREIRFASAMLVIIAFASCVQMWATFFTAGRNF